jgi:hypothetical protein
MTMEQFFLLGGLLHGAIALFATGANLYVTHRRTLTILRKDAGGLSVALAAELAGLRRLYKDNLDAIYDGGDVLVSSRMFGAIYRGNLSRIHQLPPDIIPALVTAYGMGERAEAHAAAHCKAHGATAFSMGRERPYKEGLLAAYEQAAASAERALRVLERAGKDDLAGAGEIVETEERLAQA